MYSYVHTQRQIEKHRQTQRERERDRHTKRGRDRQIDTQRVGGGQTDGGREREGETRTVPVSLVPIRRLRSLPHLASRQSTRWQPSH